jgi:hypothetical protein|tara:strand:+ start:425 stop:976 length:552 start_codon:yes stop_codon:yes gene_type:complete
MRIQFLEDIKHKIGQYVFQRDLKHNKRIKSVSNLDDSKSIGILFDATTKEQIKEIKPLVDYFFGMKKEVKAFGYVNSKNFDECHIPKLQYDFFNLKDLNWYYKPQNDYIKNFVKKEYDILINLSDSNCIPIKYLVASSVARFKVGKFEEGYDIYDLMIKLDKKEDSMARLISEIAKYLKIINK